MTLKICTKCQLEKPLEEFPRDRKRKDGRGFRCTDCGKKYYEENKATLLVQKREYTRRWEGDNHKKRCKLSAPFQPSLLLAQVA